MPTESKKWKCKHCGKKYGKQEEAENCERSHGGLLRLVEKIKPGEFVKIDDISTEISGEDIFCQIKKAELKWIDRFRCVFSIKLSVYRFFSSGKVINQDWVCETRKYSEQKMMTMLRRIFPLTEFDLLASVKNQTGGRKPDVYIKMFKQKELRRLSSNLFDQIKLRQSLRRKIHEQLSLIK